MLRVKVFVQNRDPILAYAENDKSIFIETDGILTFETTQEFKEGHFILVPKDKILAIEVFPLKKQMS